MLASASASAAPNTNTDLFDSFVRTSRARVLDNYHEGIRAVQIENSFGSVDGVLVALRCTVGSTQNSYQHIDGPLGDAMFSVAFPKSHLQKAHAIAKATMKDVQARVTLYVEDWRAAAHRSTSYKMDDLRIFAVESDRVILQANCS